MKKWLTLLALSAGLSSTGNAAYINRLKTFTGTASQWPWQLNADGTWTKQQPTLTDIASGTMAATGTFTSTAYNKFAAFVLNGYDPAAAYSLWNGGGHQTDVIAGAVTVPAGSTTFQTNAVAGYVKSLRTPVGIGGDVAGYFFGEIGANGANVFGINPVCVVSTGFTSGNCQNEFDFNINSPGITATGINMFMSGTVQPASAVAFAAQKAAGASNNWGTAFYSGPGAAYLGIDLEADVGGNNQPSQAITLSGLDAGGSRRPSQIFSDANGNVIVRSGKNGSGIALQDYNGGAGSNVAFFSAGGISLTPTVTFAASPIVPLTGYLKGNGASIVSASATIPLSDHATQGANTIVGNATSGSAAPTALAIGSCSTSGSALQWTTNTGFGCNTAINAATLGGATFASPGTIGGTTPGAATFTSLTATAAVLVQASDTSFFLNKTGGSTHANNIWGQSNGVARWSLALANNTAEGGADSGSDMTFSAFSDGGGFLANWLVVARANGVSTFSGNVASTSSSTGTVVVTGGMGVGGDVYIGGGLRTASTTLHYSTVALTNGAAAATATLTNAPAAGNPTKWIPINDNGTTRYIPAW